MTWFIAQSVAKSSLTGPGLASALPQLRYQDLTPCLSAPSQAAPIAIERLKLF